MSSNPYQSADLLLKLYDMRRESRMREARAWFIGFVPESVDDLLTTVQGPDSPSFRMVATYWDMAASFVLNGAIDEQMFNDANGEHITVFCKIYPFLAEYRERTRLPHYLKQLEALIMRMPDAHDRLTATRNRLKALAEARAAAARGKA